MELGEHTFHPCFRFNLLWSICFVTRFYTHFARDCHAISSPIFVFARPYNSGVFFLLMAFYGILELKVNQAKLWKWTFIISLGLIGAMLSHYFAFLVALVLSGLGLFYVGRKRLLYLLAAGVLAVLLFIPHLPIAFFQVGRGGSGWLS